VEQGGGADSARGGRSDSERKGQGKYRREMVLDSVSIYGAITTQEYIRRPEEMSVCSYIKTRLKGKAVPLQA